MIQTIDALIEHYALNGKLETAKFWTDTIRAGAADLNETMPGASNLYSHWVREACRETGVPFNA